MKLVVALSCLLPHLTDGLGCDLTNLTLSRLWSPSVGNLQTGAHQVRTKIAVGLSITHLLNEALLAPTARHPLQSRSSATFACPPPF